jgi:hypothetical protein
MSTTSVITDLTIQETTLESTNSPTYPKIIETSPDDLTRKKI